MAQGRDKASATSTRAAQENRASELLKALYRVVYHYPNRTYRNPLIALLDHAMKDEEGDHNLNPNGLSEPNWRRWEMILNNDKAQDLMTKALLEVMEWECLSLPEQQKELEDIAPSMVFEAMGGLQIAHPS